MDSNPMDEVAKSGRIEATEDVEGHLAKVKVNGPDTDDTEGHASRFGLVEDDVEGHGFRGNVADEDDTEGHAARGKA